MNKLLATIAITTFALTGCASHTDTTPPPCAHEDSPGPCTWDARTQGNGQGRSFWVDSDQHIHYLD